MVCRTIVTDSNSVCSADSLKLVGKRTLNVSNARMLGRSLAAAKIISRPEKVLTFLDYLGTKVFPVARSAEARKVQVRVLLVPPWKVDGIWYRDCLENRCLPKGSRGSNPLPSAKESCQSQVMGMIANHKPGAIQHRFKSYTFRYASVT